ncbi:MAG: hypothetical protein SFV22_05545 [Saprospiraceae bacterium]|nr:hypothetical protein [Saprospiraceae bacterium]
MKKYEALHNATDPGQAVAILQIYVFHRKVKQVAENFCLIKIAFLCAAPGAFDPLPLCFVIGTEMPHRSLLLRSGFGFCSITLMQTFAG